MFGRFVGESGVPDRSPGREGYGVDPRGEFADLNLPLVLPGAVPLEVVVFFDDLSAREPGEVGLQHGQFQSRRAVTPGRDPFALVEGFLGKLVVAARQFSLVAVLLRRILRW